MYYTLRKHSGLLRTLDKCRKHSPSTLVFYISLVFSNDHRVLSQCNTRLRLLYLKNHKGAISRGESKKFRRRGPSNPPPPSIPTRMKASLFRTYCIQHCGRIRDAKLSNVNVLRDRMKEHFITRFSK